MGNAPATRLTIWPLHPPADISGNASRRISLSSDHLRLYHSHVDGTRTILINEQEMHKSKKGFDTGSVHNIDYNGVTYVVTIKGEGGFGWGEGFLPGYLNRRACVFTYSQIPPSPPNSQPP
jgi:hypothetical protein